MGKGFGNGTQSQLHFLRVRHTDFIFSVIGEELGLLGTIVLFGLFTILLWRILRVAAIAQDPFGRFICVGVAVIVFLQTAVNIAVATAPGKPLIVGPVIQERLVDAGIKLPEQAEYISREMDKAEWAEQTSSKGDLVVLVSHGRSFGRSAVEIQELGRSVVAVAASKAPRWKTGHVAPRLSMIDA